MADDRQTRLIARLVRCLLAEQRFDTLADLTDALKSRCARLRVPVSNDDISTAYHWLATSGALVRGGAERRHYDPRPGREDDSTDEQLSREEAGQLLRALDVSVRSTP
jgi:hypothetical protein